MTSRGIDHHNHDNKETDSKVTPLVEEYLESILNITNEGKPAIGARLAERMNVKPATVVGAIKRLKDDGYVVVDEKSKEINLTDSGREVAVTLTRRHRLAERLLVDILGIDWADAHDEACELEHAISPRVEEALNEFLGRPQTCPHGNPIPGSGFEVDATCIALKDAAIDSEVEVSFITEEAEHEPGLLRYLQDHGLIPGMRLHIKGIAPFDENFVAINSEGREVTVGHRTAQKIWVVPV